MPFVVSVFQTSDCLLSATNELSKLSELRASGALTEAEFEAQKAKLLAN